MDLDSTITNHICTYILYHIIKCNDLHNGTLPLLATFDCAYN